MKASTPERSQVVGFRATQDFTNRFDELCHRLGHNRSYCTLAVTQSTCVGRTHTVGGYSDRPDVASGCGQ